MMAQVSDTYNQLRADYAHGSGPERFEMGLTLGADAAFMLLPASKAKMSLGVFKDLEFAPRSNVPGTSLHHQRGFIGTGGKVPNSSAYSVNARAKFLEHCHRFDTGMLDADTAQTFRGSRYSSYRLKEDHVFYRAGSSEESLGQYFSFEKPNGEFQVRIDKAILPKWPQGGISKIETGYGVRIPKSTVIHVGEIAPQGGVFLGGTQQVLIEAPWKIKGVEIVEQFSLKQEQIWQHMLR